MKIRHLSKIIVLVSISVSCQSQNSQNMSNSTIDRHPVVAGAFYPAYKQQLKETLHKDFAMVDQVIENKNILALIAPHAGYVYSGKTAAYSYKQLDQDRKYENIFIIGASHRVYFDGASIYNIGDYITPLGKVKVNTELANKLIESNEKIIFRPEAHNDEHSLEVQLPFLQYHLKNEFSIVPVIIATQNISTILEIAKALEPYFNEKNLFVISSDFSHYPGYNDAILADKHTAEGIISNEPDLFLKSLKDNEKKAYPGLATSACGWTAILTLLEITKNIKDVHYLHLNYENSGDFMYKDKSKVVGYNSIVIVKDMDKQNDKNIDSKAFSLNDETCIKLLELARNTIESYLKYGKIPETDQRELNNDMLTEAGAFVTLHKKEELRGCIGRFTADAPLYKIIQQMAVAAATEDYRFNKVTLDEMENIDLEISVLSPLKKIESIDEFVIGKHGIYIIKGYNSGTFLPQVAKETGWNAEEFLGHCARDKARIGWEGWKNAELYTYEAFVFSEKELLKK